MMIRFTILMCFLCFLSQDLLASGRYTPPGKREAEEPLSGSEDVEMSDASGDSGESEGSKKGSQKRKRSLQAKKQTRSTRRKKQLHQTPSSARDRLRSGDASEIWGVVANFLPPEDITALQQSSSWLHRDTGVRQAFSRARSHEVHQALGRLWPLINDEMARELEMPRSLRQIRSLHLYALQGEANLDDAMITRFRSLLEQNPNKFLLFINPYPGSGRMNPFVEDAIRRIGLGDTRIGVVSERMLSDQTPPGSVREDPPFSLKHVNLVGSHLGVDIGEAGLMLEGMNLRSVNLDHSFIKADFSRSDFTGASLRGVNVRHSNFDEATFRHTDFSPIEDVPARFLSSSFNRAFFENVNMQHVQMRVGTPVLEKNTFDQALLVKVQFNHALIESAYFEQTRFKDVSFVDAKLPAASFQNIEIEGPLLFEHTDLSDVIFFSNMDDAPFDKSLFLLSTAKVTPQTQFKVNAETVRVMNTDLSNLQNAPCFKCKHTHVFSSMLPLNTQWQAAASEESIRISYNDQSWLGSRKFVDIFGKPEKTPAAKAAQVVKVGNLIKEYAGGFYWEGSIGQLQTILQHEQSLQQAGSKSQGYQKQKRALQRLLRMIR